MIMDVSDGCPYPKEYNLFHKECGLPVKMITGCKKRFDCDCPQCSKKWKRKVSRQIYDAVLSFSNPSFLTLTLVKQNCGVDRMKSLWQLRWDLFRRLKSQGYKISKWVGVIEYPNHLHIVMECGFIPQQKISKIWKTVTGDSYIVDIRRLGNRAAPQLMAKYLSKYLGKSKDWTPEVVAELRSFRLHQCHGIPKAPKHHMKCPCCGEEGGYQWIPENDFWIMHEDWEKKHPPDIQSIDGVAS